MTRGALPALACLLLAACGGGAGGNQAPAAVAGPSTASTALPSGPGWTGATHPEEVIKARVALMLRTEQLLQPIDLLSVQPPRDPAALRAAATTIAAMLQAVPHLFPPTTNRYDPQAATPATIALPAVWEQFEGFQALSRASVAAAEAFAATEDPAALPAAGAALRASCDACHARFLRPYRPSQAQDADKAFDFESAIGTQ